MPLKVIVTEGTTADCTQAEALIAGLAGHVLFADRAYDVNQIIDVASQRNMQIVIPSKKNRKKPREHDKELYKLRHLVENTFLHLKRWRSIATRYAKKTASFLASVHIRCLAMWANLL
jgi:transposase